VSQKFRFSRSRTAETIAAEHLGLGNSWSDEALSFIYPRDDKFLTELSVREKTVRPHPLLTMSSSSPSTGAQINQKIDSLPPVVADKLPHLPESKEQLKEDAKEAGKKSLAGLRSLAAGGFGGVCAVIVGHPFDLVKVRLQTAERGVYSSALDVVRKSIARDGLRRGLYAGVSAPLVGVTPMCMLPFVFCKQELTLECSCCVFLGI
jgi:hypothetical protein